MGVAGAAVAAPGRILGGWSLKRRRGANAIVPDTNITPGKEASWRQKDKESSIWSEWEGVPAWPGNMPLMYTARLPCPVQES